MNTVSIAMATCDGARFIGEQLESLAGQTMPPVELVITDDRSDDSTCEIAAAFAAKAPFPVRIEVNEGRLGYRANFMKAAGLCKGDLIAFCDQDDVWLPNKLQQCAVAFENEDVWLLYHNATVVNDVLKPFDTLSAWGAPQEVNPPQTLGAWRYAQGFTEVFRRSMLDFLVYWPCSIDFNHPEEPEAHDKWFFFLASNLAAIVYLAQPLVLYRQHGRNVCGWNDISTLRWKWDLLCGPQATIIAAHADAAAHRALTLDAVRERLPATLRERADTAAAGFHKLESYLRMREEVYLSRDFMGQSRKMMNLLQENAYRPKSDWGMGRRALVKDFLRGIVFPEKRKQLLGE
jgi:glycosyltransferase involved in cell wall biosynthesis